MSENTSGERERERERERRRTLLLASKDEAHVTASDSEALEARETVVHANGASSLPDLVHIIGTTRASERASDRVSANHASDRGLTGGHAHEARHEGHPAAEHRKVPVELHVEVRQLRQLLVPLGCVGLHIVAILGMSRLISTAPALPTTNERTNEQGSKSGTFIKVSATWRAPVAMASSSGRQPAFDKTSGLALLASSKSTVRGTDRVSEREREREHSSPALPSPLSLGEGVCFMGFRVRTEVVVGEVGGDMQRRVAAAIELVDASAVVVRVLGVEQRPNRVEIVLERRLVECQGISVGSVRLRGARGAILARAALVLRVARALVLVLGRRRRGGLLLLLVAVVLGLAVLFGLIRHGCEEQQNTREKERRER